MSNYTISNGETCEVWDVYVNYDDEIAYCCVIEQETEKLDGMFSYVYCKGVKNFKNIFGNFDKNIQMADRIAMLETRNWN